MDALYRRGRATAGDHGGLTGSPSYSTVRTQLRVLEGKGHVRHEVDGVRFSTRRRSRADGPALGAEAPVDTFSRVEREGRRRAARRRRRRVSAASSTDRSAGPPRPGGGPMKTARRRRPACVDRIVNRARPAGRPAAPLPGAAARCAGRGHRRRYRGRADRCRHARRGCPDWPRWRAPGADRRARSWCGCDGRRHKRR